MTGGSSGRESSRPPQEPTTQSTSEPPAADASNSGPTAPPQIDDTDPLAHSTSNGGVPLNAEPARQPSKSSLASPEKPKKKRSLLLVPSRSSSNNKQQALTTGARDVPQEESRQESGSGIAKRYREASRASSRRSRRTQAQDSTVAAEPKVATSEMAEPAKPEKKSKGSSKLFSILSCCGKSDADSEEPPLPAKKAVKPQSSHGRQSTPVEKAEVSAGESSTAESRDPNPFDEKAAMKAGANQRSSLTENEGKGALPEEAEGSALNKSDADKPPSLDHRPSSRRRPSRTSDVGPSDGTASHGHLSGSTVAETQEDDTPDQTATSSGHGSDQAQRDTDVAIAESDEGDDDTQVPHAPNETRHQLHKIPPPPPLDRDAGKHVPPVPMVNPDKQQWLLPPIQPRFQNRKCLVLDLDETLVHSSFKVLDRADFTIPVEIEGQYHNIYVIKRPGVDQFMKRVGELYEVVVFTASVSKYGDPLLDQLDIHNVVHHRLFRDSCYNHQGNYVKDLSQVGRDLRETIIIDNSPTSYIFHPQHAIPISSWFSDAHDNELLDLIPVLEDLAGSQVQDVSLVLDVTL
ncbi:hypothetical protein FQN54_005553 [Arachnomyces sp. PD_36]|nr:hypothetical protein FQN54_005553 [Arachnomyces sp. PD_36]